MYQIEDKLAHFKTRLNDMREARKAYEVQRSFNQAQTDAHSYEDGEKFYPNTKLEQAIIEMRLGGRAGDPFFDVEPDQYNPNVQEAEIAKHFLYKFSHEEERWKEVRKRRHDKSVYGTAIRWCGISHKLTCEIQREEIKVDAQIGNGFFDKESKKKVYKEKWFFMPTNVPIYSFYIDNNALEQPDFDRAVDCIMCSYGSKEDVINRRENIPGVDKSVLESLTDQTELDPEYGEGTTKGQVTEYHYFNRITKDWVVVLNGSDLLFETEYEYECEGLPFVLCQHHPKNNKLYGMGEPEMIAPLKAAKNASWQAIIDGVMLSAGKLILAGNSGDIVDSIDSQVRVYSGEMTIKEVTNSIDQYKEIDTRIDLANHINLFEIIDAEVRDATGIDIKAPFSVEEQNLGQTEIKEENKAIRLKSIDELEDHAIGSAVTIALNNIVKFAPILKRGKKEISYNGQISEVQEEYKIHIPNVKIRKEGDKTYVEEDMGAYGELEFTDDLINGKLKVRVTTASTNNSQLSVLEKNKVMELANIMTMFANIYGVDKVTEKAPFDFVWDKTMNAYGYGDPDKRVMSKKQITREKNIEKVQQVKTLLGQMENANQPGGVQPAPGQAAPAPTGQPEVAGVLQ